MEILDVSKSYFCAYYSFICSPGLIVLHEASNCCSFLCPLRLQLYVCFQPPKPKISQSSEKAGAQTAQLGFQDEDRQGSGQVAEEHHQEEGPPGGGTASTLRTHGVGGVGNLRLGRKTVLSYLPILQAFVKQLLLPFAIQMSLPGSVVVE